MQIDAESFRVGADAERSRRQRSQGRDEIDVVESRFADKQLSVSLRKGALFEHHANV